MDAAEARMRDYIHLVDVVAARHENSGLRAIGLDRSDLEQVALIALWLAAQDYDPRAGVACRKYMLHKMHFAVIDEVRRHGGRWWRRARMFPLERDLDVDGCVEESACRNEDRARLRAVIGELPIRWRYVIEARMAGTTVPALARGFRVDESRVLQIQRAARDCMRSRLQSGTAPVFAGREEETCSSR